MKLLEISNAVRSDVMDSLGQRPEKFKYSGSDDYFVHWTGFESLKDLQSKHQKIKTGEFCTSTAKSGSLTALSGLIFYGKPRFLFPFDVYSIYDQKTGLRRVINKQEIEKRQGSIIHTQLFADDHDSEPGYDEAWCSSNEMKFVGYCSASYGKTWDQLMSTKTGINQIGTMDYLIKQCIDAEVPIYLSDKGVFEKISAEQFQEYERRKNNL